MSLLTRVVVPSAVAAALFLSQPAEACGCFAPPSAIDTVIQAGERIVFAVRDGKVIQHVQIQYAGNAQDFGWLLPLPSVPTLKLGSDELFAELNTRTVPTYDTTTVFECRSATPAFSLGCGGFAPSSRGTVDLGTQDAGTYSPLVVQASIGPYEYAVLKADDRNEMLNWLNANHYFVPAGTDSAVTPYIQPGAFFLALRLKAGANVTDITPVVLEYVAQYPMIPLVLTSVGATPHMGIQVFMVGNGRGVPRNYHHAVLNDSLLGWMEGSTNYQSLVTRAVGEAPGKHAFVTEYAGTSELMKDVLAPAGRFGLEADFAAFTDPALFVQHLFTTKFASVGSDLPSPVLSILEKQLPYVPESGATKQDFYRDATYWLGDYRMQHPEYFAAYPTFDATALAHDLFTGYVTPMREANALFTDFPKLTRLFTTLSPEDMTADPVFAFNTSLPDVSPKHAATFTVKCSQNELKTEQGWIVPMSSPGPAPEFKDTPGALRIEVLHEEGADVEVVTDNTEVIKARFPAATAGAQMSGQGCAMVDPFSLAGVAALFMLRRRRVG